MQSHPFQAKRESKERSREGDCVVTSDEHDYVQSLYRRVGAQNGSPVIVSIRKAPDVYIHCIYVHTAEAVFET